MPWQERDWAKWTDEERNRYLGTSGGRRGSSGGPTVGASRLNRPVSRQQTILACALITLFVGYAAHKVLNGPTFTWMGTPPPVRMSPPKRVPMTGVPAMIRRGTYVTARGTLGRNTSGVVIVEGRWGSGAWYRLATAPATNGTYRVRYLLDKPGLVHLRIALPDGTYLVATTRIT